MRKSGQLLQNSYELSYNGEGIISRYCVKKKKYSDNIIPQHKKIHKNFKSQLYNKDVVVKFEILKWKFFKAKLLMFKFRGDRDDNCNFFV